VGYKTSWLVGEDDQVASIHWLTKEIKDFDVEGLNEVTPKGFSYCQTTDNRLFISGGRGHFRHLHELIRSGVDQMVIIQKANSAHNHGTHAIIPVGNKFLVAASGMRGKDFSSSCELYEISTDKWQALPSLNISRREHTGCVFGEKICYLFGGWNAEYTSINEIEWLDLQAGKQW